MSQHGSYPNYKPVDAKWLGRVPVSWHVLMAKRVFSQMKLPRRKEDEQLSATQKYGVVPQRMFMEQEEQKVVLALSGIDNFKHVDKDDFVISLRSFQGGIERCHYAGCVSPAYTILKNRIPISHAYYAFLLKSNQFIAELQVATTGIRDGKTITYDQFGELRLPIPSLSEQVEIADHLDRETTRIDSLIEKKTRFIELLKEKRQAVITNAVTKGLDPSAQTQESGVEWIGRIPANWSVRPLFSAAKEVYRSNKGMVESNLLSLSYGRVVRRDINAGEGLLPDSFETYQIIEDGEIVMRLTDLQNDQKSLRTALATERGIVTSAYVVIRPSDSLNPEYLAHLMRAYDIQKVFYSMGGGMRQSMKFSDLRRLPLLIPSLQEQMAICSSLHPKLARIDQLVSKTERSIELLREHRSALITAAVTGKIDVRISK